MSERTRVRTPRTAELPEPLARAAREIAGVLRSAGHQAWLVGGAVRDLALARLPSEIDLATDAHPERIEHLFPRTIAVGKAFGTVIVVHPAADVEVTTFRSEEGYSDARRPDRVRFGASVEEDARRRDFTSNALFLDPLEDELRDPTGGMEDLRAGLLRTVGEPRERFREDGLRLLRLARFAAQLELEPAPGLLAAARESAAALRGVSVERILAELERMLAGRAPGRALGLLEEARLLERALPVWSALAPPARAERLARLARLERGAGAAAGFALLLDAARDPDAADRALEGLRASRELRRRARAHGELEAGLRALAVDAPRSRLVHLARSEAFEQAQGPARAALEERSRAALERIERALGARPEAATLRPEPWIGPADLEAVGLPRGPAWKRLLDEAEDRRLDGLDPSRAEALLWLARRAAELAREQAGQVGGNTRRKANESG